MIDRTGTYTKDGFLASCTVVIDCDDFRVGVFTTHSAIAQATVNLSINARLYYVFVHVIPPNERPHKSNQYPYLEAIKKAYPDEDTHKKMAEMRYLRDLSKNKAQAIANAMLRYAQEKLNYTPDMREKYER